MAGYYCFSSVVKDALFIPTPFRGLTRRASEASAPSSPGTWDLPASRGRLSSCPELRPATSITLQATDRLESAFLSRVPRPGGRRSRSPLALALVRHVELHKPPEDSMSTLHVAAFRPSLSPSFCFNFVGRGTADPAHGSPARTAARRRRAASPRRGRRCSRGFAKGKKSVSRRGRGVYGTRRTICGKAKTRGSHEQGRERVIFKKTISV